MQQLDRGRRPAARVRLPAGPLAAQARRPCPSAPLTRPASGQHGDCRLPESLGPFGCPGCGDDVRFLRVRCGPGRLRLLLQVHALRRRLGSSRRSHFGRTHWASGRLSGRLWLRRGRRRDVCRLQMRRSERCGRSRVRRWGCGRRRRQCRRLRHRYFLNRRRGLAALLIRHHHEPHERRHAGERDRPLKHREQRLTHGSWTTRMVRSGGGSTGGRISSGRSASGTVLGISGRSGSSAGRGIRSRVGREVF